jgi:alpha-1,3-glucan synthase
MFASPDLIVLQSTDHLMIRKGSATNPMVFPEADYNNDAFGFSNGQYQFTHQALGADSFRYSWDFGMNWTRWKNWEDTTVIDAGVFDNDQNWWQGQHIMVQCQSICYFSDRRSLFIV